MASFYNCGNQGSERELDFYQILSPSQSLLERGSDIRTVILLRQKFLFTVSLEKCGNPFHLNKGVLFSWIKEHANFCPPVQIVWKSPFGISLRSAVSSLSLSEGAAPPNPGLAPALSGEPLILSVLGPRICILTWAAGDPREGAACVFGKHSARDRGSPHLEIRLKMNGNEFLLWPVLLSHWLNSAPSTQPMCLRLQA